MIFDLKPLDVLGKRKINFMPVHFVKTKISDVEFIEDEIVNWIDTKLEGRYSMSCEPVIDSKGKIILAIYAGFENQKELTYFLLACPYLRRN
jgi:hypothetical protein